jgi:DUF1680 family protein
MLKLTRLLHFHEPDRADLPDFYERTLFNHLLGTQDPRSAHGFACYYTGLSVGAVKRQPLNYFPRGDPGAYATDYDTFTCDTATGLETPARFTEAIYARDPDGGLRVNQFISSEVRLPGLALRQDSGLPDEPSTLLTVTGGGGYAPVRIRVPGWSAGPPDVRVNNTTSRVTTPAGRPAYLSVTRRWRTGDQVRVTFPVTLTVRPAPDASSVAAVTYGPVVLAGLTGDSRGPGPSYLPVLDLSSLRRAPAGLHRHRDVLGSGQPRCPADPGSPRGPPALHRLLADRVTLPARRPAKRTRLRRHPSWRRAAPPARWTRRRARRRRGRRPPHGTRRWTACRPSSSPWSPPHLTTP